MHEIAGDDGNIAATPANAIGFRLSFLPARFPRMQNDADALRRQPLGDGSADAPSRAGDDRNLRTGFRAHASVHATKRVCSKAGTAAAKASSQPTRRG